MPVAPATNAPTCSLVSTRSASGVTVETSVSWLLPATGSGVVPSTRAVLLRLPVRLLARSAVTVISGATSPSPRSLPEMQVTIWPEGEQAQPVPLAARNVVPAGSVSVTVIGARDTDGPRLVTVSVQLNGVPGTGCRAIGWLFAMARSARATTRAVSSSVLFAGTGSKVLAETVAALVSAAPAGTVAATSTTTESSGKAVLAARVSAGSLRVQRIGAVPEQVQPGPPADLSVVPAGRTSVTVNGPVARSGPVLRTTTVQVPSPPAMKLPTCDLVTVRSADAMLATAVDGPPVYGPLAFPVAPVASSKVARTVFVCGTESPAPGLLVAAAPGRRGVGDDNRLSGGEVAEVRPPQGLDGTGGAHGRLDRGRQARPLRDPGRPGVVRPVGRQVVDGVDPERLRGAGVGQCQAPAERRTDERLRCLQRSPWRC